MFYLIRHTRPGVDARICYGRRDVPLAETADADIDAALVTLPPAHAIFSSPARRCMFLATAVGRRDRICVRADERLLEIDFGRWEGRFWADVPRVEIDAWANDPWRVSPGSGESLQSLWSRIGDFRAEHLTAANMRSSELTLIVSHHGPLRVLWAQARGCVPARMFRETFAYGISGVHTLALRQQSRRGPDNTRGCDA